MQISLIAALSDGGVIGVDNHLPWRLPVDMRWFRRHTLGKPIIMGRHTFESFGAKPLAQRRNIVVTSERTYRAPGAVVVHDIEIALAAAGEGVESGGTGKPTEVMIIGGARLYAQMLPRAQRLYLTQVHVVVEGDAWFPDYDASAWRESAREEHAADEKNPHACTFLILDRREQ